MYRRYSVHSSLEPQNKGLSRSHKVLRKLEKWFASLVTVTPSEPEAYLTSKTGVRQFPLVSGLSWAIGRGEGCAVMLDSRSVSRLHALIQRREDGDFSL